MSHNARPWRRSEAAAMHVQQRRHRPHRVARLVDAPPHLQRAFQQDMARSQRIDRDAWARRGVLERAKEWEAGLFSKWF